MLSGSVPQTMVQVLAAGAFLPAGKGAIILIMGGLVMVLISIVAAVLGRRRRMPVGALAYAQPPTRGGPANLNQNAWAGSVVAAIGAAGLGRPVVAASDAERLVVVLEDCRSCRSGRRTAHGCEPERQVIEAATFRAGRRATVEERSCNPRGLGECTFEVRLQGRP